MQAVDQCRGTKSLPSRPAAVSRLPQIGVSHLFERKPTSRGINYSSTFKVQPPPAFVDTRLWRNGRTAEPVTHVVSSFISALSAGGLSAGKESKVK